MSALRTAIITCSDSLRDADVEDVAGRAIMDAAEGRGWSVVAYHVTLRDLECVTASLFEMSDIEDADVVLTIGATGLERRDIVPEATLDVVEREVPGIAEAIRARRSVADEAAFLYRGVAGEREGTLIVNLPGGKDAALEGFSACATLLELAVASMRPQP